MTTTNESALDLTRRDERALSMRIAGIPIERVAATFGWTPEQAHEAVERALVRVTVDRNPEGVKHQRMLTEKRLDGLFEAMWPTATDPNGHPLIQQNAVKTALAIIDRQVDLYGQNAPKESVVTHNVGPDQVAATIERLFAARSGVIEADVLAITGSAEPGDDDSKIIDAEVVDLVEDVSMLHDLDALGGAATAIAHDPQADG